MSDVEYSDYFSSAKEVKLINAITTSDVDLIKQLAREGVNLNAVGKFENTPLRVAVKLRHKQIVRLLLQLGVSPNSRTPKGTVAAADDVVTEKDPEYLRIFFEFGLDPNLKCEGVPLIFFAVSRSNWQQYDMLLAKGADINSKTPDGSSLLYNLVLQFEYDRAKALFEKGADFTATNKFGSNVLGRLVDAQRRFCVEPGLADCYKRAELLRLMQERGIAVPPGLPYM